MYYWWSQSGRDLNLQRPLAPNPLPLAHRPVFVIVHYLSYKHGTLFIYLSKTNEHGLILFFSDCEEFEYIWIYFYMVVLCLYSLHFFKWLLTFCRVYIFFYFHLSPRTIFEDRKDCKAVCLIVHVPRGGAFSDTNFWFSFVLFPGCIVCCSPCCSITLIYVPSLLCLSFHTCPSEPCPLCLSPLSPLFSSLF